MIGTNETFESIRCTVDDGVAVVTLDWPERGNPWTLRLALELDAVCHQLDRDDDARVVVFTGEGSVFSVGADLSGGAVDEAGAATAGEVPADPLFPSRLRKPVIAALNGHTVGGGLSFAMHCDIRILADSAKIGFPFVRRGLTSEMGMSWLLPRTIGRAASTDLLLTGRILLAPEALTIGLVHRVVPKDDVLHEALALAADLAANVAPLAAAETKALLWASMEASWPTAYAREMDAFWRCVAHPDVAEGVASFLEKRPPQWTGRPSELWSDPPEDGGQR